MRHILTVTLEVLARALVLLAFSEFLFFNEDPVQHYLAAPSTVGKALHLAELVVFYCLPGSLLLALDPMMTTWPRTILVGAFVGWSIEAAMVPVAYENVPFSFFWTSVSWHAMIDVCLGWVLLRKIMQSSKMVTKLASAILLGGLTALWSTWAWEDLNLDIGQFSEVVGVALALIAVGYALSDRSQRSPVLRRTGFRIVVGINFALWAVWASAFLPMSLGLLALAACNGWLLKSAPTHNSSQSKDPIAVWHALTLVIGIPSAAFGFWLIEATDLSRQIADITVLCVALGGTAVYAWAAVSAFRGRPQRSKSL